MSTLHDSTCSAATACSEAGTCAHALTPPELTQLALTLLLPVAFALLTPSLCQRTTKAHRHATPLCGPPCLRVPTICATTGLLSVLAVLVFAVVPTYFALLFSPEPCATPLGGCATISCVCGTYYQQGYVFMFVTLVLIAVLMMREVSALGGATLCHRVIRALMTLGSMGVVLTAIYPERYTQDRASYGENNNELGFLRFAYSLHILGLGLTLSSMCLLPFCWFCLSGRLLEPDRASFRQLVLTRAIHHTAALAYAGIFLFLRASPDTTDYCSPIQSASACSQWPLLPASECAALTHLPGFRPQPYLCTWVNASLSEEARLLLPSSYVAAHEGVCRKHECLLFAFARSIALEFGALFLAATYAITYGLEDAKRLSSPSLPYSNLGRPAQDTEPPGLQPLRVVSPSLACN